MVSKASEAKVPVWRRLIDRAKSAVGMSSAWVTKVRPRHMDPRPLSTCPACLWGNTPVPRRSAALRRAHGRRR
jgi:hypothetical protein